ncbi:MAG: hypothetical protein ACREOQ_06455, partial [Gemmatimonadales bacterium]
MRFTSTIPLRRAIQRLLPDRPFAIELWDGSGVPATSDHGPTLSVRSPRGVAHMLRAPGQLGLGRAYVTGELDVADLDALVHVADTWRPPPLSARSRAHLML